ncbi:APC family permease [Acidaminococcus sp.]|uniref:APC family permease n=1 Tax=Acidaminococcus sp. TaxID=1872103 RepID=UPI003520FFF0
MSSEQMKKIGLVNIIGLGVGGAIGSGIFVTLGSAIGMTGRSVLVVTLIGVFYMLFAYWYNLALSSIFVVNGGDYSMRGMMLPPVLTGYGGWTNVMWAFGITGYSLALTSYLSSLWPVLGEHTSITSMVILTVHFLLTIRGNRIVTIFQNTATAFLLIALFLFIVLGVPHVDPAFFFSPAADGGFFHGGMSGVISAIAIMGFACQGTTMGPVGVARITKNPKLTIPLGILVTCAVVSVVYGLMSYVAAGVLPYDKVANQNLSVVASAFLNPVLFAFFIIGGGACAIVSSFLGVLVMIREPLASMADDGWLTGFFGRKAKDGYPYGAFTLVYILAAIPNPDWYGFQQCNQYADDSLHVHQRLSEHGLHKDSGEIPGAVRQTFHPLPSLALQTVLYPGRHQHPVSGHHSPERHGPQRCHRGCNCPCGASCSQLAFPESGKCGPQDFGRAERRNHQDRDLEWVTA